MKTAESYLEWRESNVLLGRTLYQEDNYVRKIEQKWVFKLKEKVKAYNDVLENGSDDHIRRLLRQDLLRKDITETTSNPIVKAQAKKYQDVQLRALNRLASIRDHNLNVVDEIKMVREKLRFFEETKLSYGNSALLLSGGATLGLMHMGVIKALCEQKLLPKVIGGSSAGSICCAFLGTATDKEILERFEPENLNLKFLGRKDSLAQDMDKFLSNKDDNQKNQSSNHVKGIDSTSRAVIVALPPPFQDWLSLFRRLLPRYIDNKVLLDGDILAKALKDIIGDITFLEAYNKTGRILNISVTPQFVASINASVELPQLLNYLTTPDVVIWSAAVASSAIPGVFAPQPLLKKTTSGKLVSYGVDEAKWADGSLECDLPISRIRELFDVNHFIVSQVNPHARLIAPHKEINFFGFMPSTLAEISTEVWGQIGAIVMFLRDQIRSWTKHVVDYSLKSSIFKQFGKGVLPLITQKYHGDITLRPEISLKDLSNLLTNPDKKTFLSARIRGERMTWPKIDKIKRRCAIEFMLDDCIAALKKRETQLEKSLFSAFTATQLPKPASVNSMDNLQSTLKNRIVSVLHMNDGLTENNTSRAALSVLAEELKDTEDYSDTEPPMF